jgi:hypothetical protein
VVWILAPYAGKDKSAKCPVWKIQSRNICEKIRFNDYVLKNFFGDRAKLKTGDLGKSV